MRCYQVTLGQSDVKRLSPSEEIPCVQLQVRNVKYAGYPPLVQTVVLFTISAAAFSNRL